MPLYDYKCTDGHEFEELVLQNSYGPVPCEVPHCNCIANRSTVYAVTTVGPVFDQLEEFNRTLLTPQQRAAGIELKSKSQVEAYEEMKGYRRVDPNALSTKVAISDCLDDHNDISKMQQSTGWGDAKYTNWKRGHDAAIDAARDGKVGLESADRRPNKKPTS